LSNRHSRPIREGQFYCYFHKVYHELIELKTGSLTKATMGGKCKEGHKEYTRVWMYERNQKIFGEAYDKGDSRFGFCECGSYFKRPKYKETEKCTHCRKRKKDD